MTFDWKRVDLSWPYKWNPLLFDLSPRTASRFFLPFAKLWFYQISGRMASFPDGFRRFYSWLIVLPPLSSLSLFLLPLWADLQKRCLIIVEDVFKFSFLELERGIESLFASQGLPLGGVNFSLVQFSFPPSGFSCIVLFSPPILPNLKSSFFHLFKKR